MAAPADEDPAEMQERLANQAKADELAEQARHEKMAEVGGGEAAASASPKASRRKSSLDDSVLADLAGGIHIGEDGQAAASGNASGGAAAAEEEPSGAYAVAPKSVQDILAQDAEDESLKKYKESLLGAAAAGDLGDTSDARRLVVVEFRVIFEEAGAPDVVFDLSTPDGIANLSSKGYSIKEGSHYKLQLSFRVNGDILSGLKFASKVKKGVFSNSDELMIGSYAPASQPHVFTFPRYGYNECPKGMLYRGKYVVEDSFKDSDGVTHLEYSYKMIVGKTW